MQLNYIANASVPSASGRTIPVIDPSDGQPFDEIQRSNADDIDAAVHAARQCYNAVWQKLAPVERGRLLQKLSAKILEHADELTALEQRDCGKPTKQARADAIALARYFEFYAGACDKFHGETIPYPDGLQRAHLARAPRRDRPCDPLELPHADLWPQRGRRAGGGQRLRGQTGRRRLPLADPRGAAGGRGGLSHPARFNIVTGYGHEVGDAARAPPRHRPHQLHRQPQDRHADPASGGRAPLPRDAGAGRQKPADHLCRRRPGRSHPRGHQRHRAERGADLLGRFARAHRLADLRAPAGAPGQGFRGSFAWAPPPWTWTWAR